MSNFTSYPPQAGQSLARNGVTPILKSLFAPDESMGLSDTLLSILAIFCLYLVLAHLLPPRKGGEAFSQPPPPPTSITMSRQPSQKRLSTASLQTLAMPWQAARLSGLSAGLDTGFCGVTEVHLSRVPHGRIGSGSWATVFSVVHPQALSLPAKGEESAMMAYPANRPPMLDWSGIRKALHLGESKDPISRATLMTLLALTNARPIFSLSSAAGYRSAYPSYCGQWSITWPIGKPCIVSFSAHDSHAAAKDVYPPSFPARVDKCVEMLSGVVSDGRRWKLAFSGRVKSEGPWFLKHRRKGLAGAHGSRHLWNMVGGNVWEVDLLYYQRRETEVTGRERRLEVPAVDGSKGVIFFGDGEQILLAKALDYLPWNALSWSMHRGMRDVLLAFGKPVMDQCRPKLAAVVKDGVRKIDGLLVKKGWNSRFVHDAMPDLAETSILAGSGNSGDLVRIVVAVVECLVEASKVGASIDKDATNFWHRTKRSEDIVLDLDTTVALTKFFVLEWSQELDYQLYHALPVELYLA